MKRYTITSLLAAVLLVSFVMTGCNKYWKNMPKNKKDITWTPTPNPLEMHGEKVAIKVTGTFPALYFDKKAKMVITPVLKYATDEKALTPITVQGEKFKDNNPTIKFKEGGSFEFSDTLAFADPMRRSTLEVRIEATRGKSSKVIKFDPIVIVEGVKTTPRLVQYGLEIDAKENGGDGYDASSNYGKVASITDIPISQTSTSNVKAQILYDLQKYNLKPTETKKKEVSDLFASVATNSTNPKLVFKGIELQSYASPDGPLALNDKLSQDRGKTAVDYLTKTIKKNKTNVDVAKVDNKALSEDWAGFQEELDKSNIADKELIKRVLTMYSDPQVREREIMNLAAAYDQLKKDILPMLRRSKIIANYETPKKPDADILKLALTNPTELNDEELLFATTLTKNVGEKATILSTYTTRQPSDWKALNQLGICYLHQNKLPDAKTAFEKSNAASKNQFAVNNLGVVALAQGDLKAAESYFTMANSITKSESANYNLGYIALRQGDYAKAVSFFGNSNSFNSALATLLLGSPTGNPEGAWGKLQNMKSKEHPIYFYLRAVIASRQDKKDVLLAELKQAIDKKSELKQYAKEDVEFLKFFADPDFQKLVQ